ncbi:hypothetical protein HEP81_06809 [Streptomyces griseofuscus]|uniref:Uncharacterized protein n=1 Tax=Streptomyces griseofuscus TaxID=146922 RepID=A0A7H1Q9R3_9ACTN|nr:hypothetical protein HEP81_06809 [Streptomyces griseofuscus]
MRSVRSHRPPGETSFNSGWTCQFPLRGSLARAAQPQPVPAAPDTGIPRGGCAESGSALPVSLPGAATTSIRRGRPAASLPRAGQRSRDWSSPASSTTPGRSPAGGWTGEKPSRGKGERELGVPVVAPGVRGHPHHPCGLAVPGEAQIAPVITEPRVLRGVRPGEVAAARRELPYRTRRQRAVARGAQQPPVLHVRRLQPPPRTKPSTNAASPSPRTAIGTRGPSGPPVMSGHLVGQGAAAPVRCQWTWAVVRSASAVGAVPPRWAGSHQESSGPFGRPG